MNVDGEGTMQKDKLEKYHFPPKWSVSLHTRRDEVKKRMPNLPKKVLIRDVTIREGEEMPVAKMSLGDKIAICQKLVNIGIREIEVGYVGALEEQRKAMEALNCRGIRCVKSAICRWYVQNWKEEIDIAVSTGADMIKIQTLGGPEWVYKYYFDKYSEYYKNKEIIPRMVEAVHYVKDNYKLPVQVALTDGPRTELRWMKQFFKAAMKAKAERISFHDSRSSATPLVMQYLAEELKTVTKGIPIGTHCHNDFGLATANTLGAVQGGVKVVDVTVNGYGDRAGNAPLEEVALSLEILYGVDTGIDKRGLYELCKFVEKITGVNCQPHKPVVGENTFLEESELHIYAMLQASRSDLGKVVYLPYSPQVVGQTYKIVWGTTSLWGEAIGLKLRQLGYGASKENIEKVRHILTTRFKKSMYVSNSELEDICKKSLSKEK